MFPDLFVSWPMARIQKDEAAALSHEQVERDRTKILGLLQLRVSLVSAKSKIITSWPKRGDKVVKRNGWMGH